MVIKPKIIFLPGNGGDGNTEYCWFPYIKKELENLGCEVIAPTFPDGMLARASLWLPFLESLGTDNNTILIGHSSGVVAAMRYAQDHTLLSSVLVAPCYTDLGLESEKVSGYYNDQWNWDKIIQNQKWIIQFSSTNDPFIPIDEARLIHEKLHTEYYELSEGHFMQDSFSELVEVVTKRM